MNPKVNLYTMKMSRREFLGIYLYAKPRNEQQRMFNQEMLNKAEAIRSHWVQSIINEDYGFLDKTKMMGDFLEYYRNIALAKRENSKWWGSYQHFEKFIHGHCTFEQMDVYIAKRFAEYLMTATSVRRPGVPMHTNTRASYFSTFRAVLKEHTVIDCLKRTSTTTLTRSSMSRLKGLSGYSWLVYRQ